MTTIQNYSGTQLPYQNQCQSAQADAFHGVSSSDIDELLQGNPNLWRGCDMAGQGVQGRSTGFPQLDAILPGHGRH